MTLFREKGYSATTVADLCAAAEITKGGFFHYFDSKEAVALAAIDHWAELLDARLRAAPYHDLSDPLDRVLGYIAFRQEMLRGGIAEMTSLDGVLVQENFESNLKIRNACRESLLGHSAKLVQDIAAAKELYAPKARWSAESLAQHIQAVIQGAFVLAKAQQSAMTVSEHLLHLSQYLELLFKKGRAR